MANFGIFCLGIGIGVAVMLFHMFVSNMSSQYLEIQWHDAQLEEPTEYENEYFLENKWTNVLVRCVNGSIYTAYYCLSTKKYYGTLLPDTMTHFAYIEEIKQTVPLNPVNVEPPHYDCLYGL